MIVLEGLGTLVLHELFEAEAAESGTVVSDGTLWFRAYFYAVMSFCNAGFSLDPGSLAVFRAQPLVLVTMGLLVIAGGFGFLVVLVFEVVVGGVEHPDGAFLAHLILMLLLRSCSAGSNCFRGLFALRA